MIPGRVDIAERPAIAAEKRQRKAHAHKIETITYDNGKEFAGHANSSQAWRSNYFASLISWERGRTHQGSRIFKRLTFTLTPADVQRVEDKLNSRPRKALGYKTPSEVFFAAA